MWALRERAQLHGLVARMTSALTHRGPDGEGVWLDQHMPIALGHRRLAVIDTSPLGRQPMASPDGRVIVTYNGEVYNYKAIRADLIAEGLRFASDTDTEVVAGAIAHWGIERALDRFVGMFALAAWFSDESRLILARDRVGVKPLYYRWDKNDGLLFGSELRALEVAGFPTELEPKALSQYMAFGYIASPLSIYAGVLKLPPATWLEVLADEAGRPCPPMVRRYWSLPISNRDNASVTSIGSTREVIHALLRDSVALRLIADVPLGAFLSGGIDSPLVVALMQEAASSPVRTFTIGFADPGWPDESERAATIARHLGTDHTTWRPCVREVQAAAELMPATFDEPFADSSMIPTYLVSVLARQHVTVALSGDGGDEGFLGYDRYGLDDRLLRAIGWLGRMVPSSNITQFADWIGQGDALQLPRWVRRIGSRARLLSAARTPETLYRWAVGADSDGCAMLRRELQDHCGEEAMNAGNSEAADVLAINRRDLLRYLPDDVLVKVDRASMSVGLEAREPLLDHRLIEAALALPRDLRRPTGGPGKRILRDILTEYLPNELIEGPKRGFGAPVHAWLVGPLREWAAHFAAIDDDILDSAAVAQLWRRWVGGRCTSREVERLWRVLMLRAWLSARPAATASRDRLRPLAAMQRG